MISPQRQLLAYCIPFGVVMMALGSSITCDASTCTATTGGSWTSAATWSCGNMPQPGDIAVVPAGLTVTVNSNVAYTGASMRLKIYGAVFFVGGGSKLSFPCGSIVELMTPGSSVDGDNEGNSQTIKICGVPYWEVRDGYTTGYLAWGGSTLPVQLLYFRGDAAHAIVELSWATATETNTDRFELYRSHENGPGDLVAVLPAAGSSQQMITYRCEDHPSPQAWTYRLVEIDLDGAPVELGTISVHTGSLGEVFCHPVPACDQLVIHATELPCTLVIRDLHGREVGRKSLMDESTAIPIDQLSNGTYMAQLINGDRVYVQRLEVAH